MGGYWIGRDQIAAIISDYLALFPDESARLRELELLAHAGYAVNRRENAAGHVTVAPVLIDAGYQVLHRVHPAPEGGLWTLPTGHLKPLDESVMAAARRRASMASGIPGECLRPLVGHELIPLDIGVPLARDGLCVDYELRYGFTVDAGAVTTRGPELVEWLPIALVKDPLLRGKLLHITATTIR
jgi:hypothetical protein